MLHAAMEPGRELDHNPVDLAHERPTIIGPIMIEPSLRRVSAKGKVIILEPKVMQVLVALLRDEERILSRDDLIDVCWNGTIVGDGSINRVISLLRSSLREVAGDGLVIETVPKVGYRLLVHDETPDMQAATPSPTAPDPVAKRLGSRLLLVAALLVALLGAAAFYFNRSASSSSMTIAIVPIEAVSPGDRFYASGMTGEIGSRLADLYGVRITAPKSVESLAAAGVDPMAIGKRLRADAVLIGKLARVGNDIVLTLSLYSVAESRSIWNGQLRSPATQANDLPDRTLEALRKPLALTAPVASRFEGIGSSSYSLYLVARGMLRTRDPEQIRIAESMLTALTEAEPRFSKGWAALAKAVALGRGQHSNPEWKTAMAQARRYSARALMLDGESAEALAVAGMLAHDLGKGQGLLEKSLSLEPNNAEAWLWLANTYVSQGDERKALEALVRQLSIDPLWERSAQAPEAAAALGEIALADQLDREVMRVAVEGWQRDLGQARIARRHGDWSTFVRLSGSASLAAPAQQRTGIDRSLMAARSFIDLPFQPLDNRTRSGILQYDILRGEVPTKAQLFAGKVGAHEMFFEGSCLALLPQLLVSKGRTGELLAYFDDAFGSVEELLQGETAVDRNLNLEGVPYLALAIKEEGRTSDWRRIEQHFVPRMAAVASGADPTAIDVVVSLARLAAVFDRPDMARRLLVRARAMGWPDSAVLDYPPLMGTLQQDPAFASLKGQPWFIDLGTTIETNRSRERREVSTMALLY